MHLLTLTNIIIGFTVLISWQAFNNPELMQKLLKRPYTIKRDGEYYRLVTSGFVHANFTHLFVNMFVLYQFGSFTEHLFGELFGTTFGRIAYLLFYLSAIVVASLPDYFRHQDNYVYSALGASGATSALVFAYIVFNPWQWFIFPPLPALLFGVAYLFYSSYMDKKGGDNIGHNAHFWGALYGVTFIILTIFLTRPELFNYIIAQLLQGPIMPF